MIKNISSALALSAVTLLISACNVMPQNTRLLDQTRSDFLEAQNNQNVAKYAPVEMGRATEMMTQTDAAANRAEGIEKIDQLAYLTKQQIGVAQEVAKRKLAESEISEASQERDRVLLGQRTKEAEQAQASAAQSALTSKQMRNQALQTETLMLELSAQTTDRGTVIVFSDLLFASGLTQLNADGMRATQKLADILRNNPKRTVLIESFTDTTIATSARKMQLSEGRANAVRNNLMGMGVGEKRIAIRAYGEAHPVADNDSGANRQLNQRVEIVFSDVNGRIAPR